jgi:tRNA 2-thiouridine synthesizing protein C
MKKLLFVMRHAPYGTSLAREGLDTLLACAAFEQEISLLFLHDGVFQLLKNQQPETIEQKSIQHSLAALPLYGVTNIYVDQQSLAKRKISPDDLNLKAEHIAEQQVSELFELHDVIFQF